MNEDCMGDMYDEKMFFPMYPPVLQVQSDHRGFPAAARRRFWMSARVRAALCYYNRTIIGTDARRYTCVHACMHARTKYTPTVVVRAPSRCKDRQLN